MNSRVLHLRLLLWLVLPAVPSVALKTCDNHVCAGTCNDHPWTAYGQTCNDWVRNKWCGNGGEGRNWLKTNGKINDATRFTNATNPKLPMPNDITPAEACCECGGGSGQYRTDFDAKATCIKNTGAGEPFSCKCSEGWTEDPKSGVCLPTYCPENQRVSNHKCVPCPPGTLRALSKRLYCNGSPDRDSKKYETCGDSTAETGDSTQGKDTQCQPVLCAENHFASKHRCLPCALGKAHAAGADSSLAKDTVCTDLKCPKDHFAANKTCIPCAKGFTHAAGANAFRNTTSCVSAVCPVNTRVSDHACVPCDPGTASKGGDKAGYEDTKCSPIFCKADQFVSNHKCQPCGYGLVNPSHDDASGADTKCSVMCKVADLGLPRGYTTLVTEKDRFISKVDGSLWVKPFRQGTVACDTGAQMRAGDSFRIVYCTDIKDFKSFKYKPGMCTDIDACKKEPKPGVSSEQWCRSDKDKGATCVDRQTPEVGSTCACTLKGYKEFGGVCSVWKCARGERVFNHSCTPCVPGKEHPPGALATGQDTACTTTICKDDHYVKDHKCVPCPERFINTAGDAATGEDTLCDPRPCAVHHHVKDKRCVHCPNGYTRPWGDNFLAGDTQCLQLESCTYKFNDTTTADMPTHLCAAQGDIHSQCTDLVAPSNGYKCNCSVGYQAVAVESLTPTVSNRSGDFIREMKFTYATSLVQRHALETLAVAHQVCAHVWCTERGHRVSKNRCVPCDPGMKNEPGDRASGEDTQCEPILCGWNESVVDHKCTPCEPGSDKPPGDDASGIDTKCNPILCAKHQYVSKHACTACAPGTTNHDGGHDSSRADTKCDITYCAARQRVKAHTCVPCTPGTNNSAYDDASGRDTACASEKCHKNMQVYNHTCIPCPPGTTSFAGAEAMLPDYNFYPGALKTAKAYSDFRPPPQHAYEGFLVRQRRRCRQCSVLMNHCVRCRTAFACDECAPGYALNRTSRQCYAVYCEVDYKVENYLCVKCVANAATGDLATNAAGDAARVNNTACDELYTIAVSAPPPPPRTTPYPELYASVVDGGGEVTPSLKPPPPTQPKVNSMHKLPLSKLKGTQLYETIRKRPTMAGADPEVSVRALTEIHCSQGERCFASVWLTNPPTRQVVLRARAIQPSKGSGNNVLAVMDNGRMVPPASPGPVYFFNVSVWQKRVQVDFAVPQQKDLKPQLAFLALDMFSDDHHYHNQTIVFAVKAFAAPKLHTIWPVTMPMDAGKLAYLQVNNLRFFDPRVTVEVLFSNRSCVSLRPSDKAPSPGQTALTCTVPRNPYGQASTSVRLKTAFDVQVYANAGPTFYYNRRCDLGRGLFKSEAKARAHAAPGAPPGSEYEVCWTCPRGYYSLEGVACVECPVGSSCLRAQENIEGTMLIGEVAPKHTPGYFRANIISNGSSCLHVLPNGLTCDDYSGLKLAADTESGPITCDWLEAEPQNFDCSGCDCSLLREPDVVYDFDTYKYHKCEWPENRCMGGPRCASNYANSSWMCAECAPQHARYQRQCYPCGDYGTAPFLNLPILACVLVVLISSLVGYRHHLFTMLRMVQQIGRRNNTELSIQNESADTPYESKTSTSTNTDDTPAASPKAGSPKKKRKVRHGKVAPEERVGTVGKGKVVPTLEVVSDDDVAQVVPRESKRGPLAAARNANKDRRGKRSRVLAASNGKEQFKDKTQQQQKQDQKDTKWLLAADPAWRPFLVDEDPNRYDVMRLRLVDVLMTRLAKKLASLTSILKMMIGYMQCLGALNHIPALQGRLLGSPFRWPIAFSVVLLVMDVVDLSVFMLPSLQCYLQDQTFMPEWLARVGVYHNFAVAVGVVVVALLCIQFAFGIRRKCKCCCCRASDQLLEAQKLKVKKPPPPPPDATLWTHSMWVVMLTYFTVVRVSVPMFFCTPGDGDSWWLTAQPDVECYTSTHDAFRIAAGAVLVLYGIGWPMLLGIVLRRKRDSLEADVTIKWLGLAYAEYKHRYYYFELIEITRKLLLAALLGPLLPANDLQALAAVVICGIFCIIGIILRPFKVPGQNIAYNFALFTLFVITLVGLAMGSVDDLAPIGQPAHPEETSEFGVVDANTYSQMIGRDGKAILYSTHWVEDTLWWWGFRPSAKEWIPGRMTVAVFWDCVLVALVMLSLVAIVAALQLKTWVNRLLRHISRAIDDFIQKSRPKLPEEVPLSKIELETDEKKPEVLGDDGPLGESKVEPDDAAAAMDAATEMDAKGKIEAQRENDAMAADAANDQDDLGTIVESRSCQTDPAEAIELSNERLRKSNLSLFQQGRQLQLENKRILKKLALARMEAAKAQPNLRWKRDRINQLKNTLAEIDDANTDLAVSNQKQEIEQLTAINKKK